MPVTLQALSSVARVCRVNGLSQALPYNAQDWEYVGVETPVLAGMYNMTCDRLHTNGMLVDKRQNVVTF